MATHYVWFGGAYEIFNMAVMVIENMWLNRGMLPNYFFSIIYAPAASVLEIRNKAEFHSVTFFFNFLCARTAHLIFFNINNSFP